MAWKSYRASGTTFGFAGESRDHLYPKIAYLRLDLPKNCVFEGWFGRNFQTGLRGSFRRPTLSPKLVLPKSSSVWFSTKKIEPRTWPQSGPEVKAEPQTEPQVQVQGGPVRVRSRFELQTASNIVQNIKKHRETITNLWGIWYICIKDYNGHLPLTLYITMHCWIKLYTEGV